ncbi:MAG: cupin domain-containing protein [Pseudomonadota bacterium]
MTSEKASVRVQRFEDLVFQPRFEYGDMAQVAGVCGADDGTDLGVGYGRLTKARIPWTIKYDEVLTVLEGHLTVHVGDQRLEAGPRDCIWLPAGTELVYEAEAALISFAIHPSNWAEKD